MLTFALTIIWSINRRRILYISGIVSIWVLIRISVNHQWYNKKINNLKLCHGKLLATIKTHIHTHVGLWLKNEIQMQTHPKLMSWLLVWLFFKEEWLLPLLWVLHQFTPYLYSWHCAHRSLTLTSAFTRGTKWTVILPLSCFKIASTFFSTNLPRWVREKLTSMPSQESYLILIQHWPQPWETVSKRYHLSGV